MHNSVLMERRGSLGRVSLNAANNRNVLSLNICEQLYRVLQAWLHDDAIQIVLVDQSEEASEFCSGSDWRLLADSHADWGESARRYLRALYNLVQLIADYPKPFAVIADGATRGGGFGIFANARYRIATERTVVSFPETGLGYVPDCGATWHLANLPGELGTWLALTGAELRGEHVLAAGLATHLYQRDELEKLKLSLANDGPEAFSGLVSQEPLQRPQDMAQIDAMFAGSCATIIRYGLERRCEWADRQTAKLDAKSPLSTKIALRQVRTGRILGSVRDALKIEYRIASRLIHSYNLREGVRAHLVDQDYDPCWKPAQLVKVNFDMVASFFSPLEQGELRLCPTDSSRLQPISKSTDLTGALL